MKATLKMIKNVSGQPDFMKLKECILVHKSKFWAYKIVFITSRGLSFSIGTIKYRFLIFYRVKMRHSSCDMEKNDKEYN